MRIPSYRSGSIALRPVLTTLPFVGFSRSDLSDQLPSTLNHASPDNARLLTCRSFLGLVVPCAAFVLRAVYASIRYFRAEFGGCSYGDEGKLGYR